MQAQTVSRDVRNLVCRSSPGLVSRVRSRLLRLGPFFWHTSPAVWSVRGSGSPWTGRAASGDADVQQHPAAPSRLPLDPEACSVTRAMTQRAGRCRRTRWSHGRRPPPGNHLHYLHHLSAPAAAPATRRGLRTAPQCMHAAAPLCREKCSASASTKRCSLMRFKRMHSPCARPHTAADHMAAAV